MKIANNSGHNLGRVMQWTEKTTYGEFSQDTSPMSNTPLFGKRRVAAKLHYSYINQFMVAWVKWQRPCDLKVQRSEKDPELIGICFDVENNNTIDMIEELKFKLRIDVMELS